MGPLSKFADDTKLRRFVNLLEGRKGLQRDLDRLDKWAKASCIRFNKVKCWVLHLSHKNPMQSYRFTDKRLESCLIEKEVGGAGQQPAEYETVVCASVQEDQQHPGSYQK